jgi:tripartite-type tricarboxylate transporter receptor subunit TctC
MIRIRMLEALLLAFVGLSVAGPTSAQIYPSHPITIVVPFAPGGATDVLPRMLGERLRASLGQPVIIENVSGAGGTIGLGVGLGRARSADGYTLVSGNWSTFVSSGAIYTLPYDLVKDFEPVVLLPANSHLIVARKSLAAGNLLELVSWLEANQDTVSMATAGVGTGSHLAAVLLQRLTDTKFPLVHYRGGGPALQDLFSQQIDLMTNQAAVFLPHMWAGTIKVYAVLAKDRLVQAPEIPTADDAGLPGFHVSVWNGFWVPKGTPGEVIRRLKCRRRGYFGRARAAPAPHRSRLRDSAARAANPGSLGCAAKGRNRKVVAHHQGRQHQGEMTAHATARARSGSNSIYRCAAGLVPCLGIRMPTSRCILGRDAASTVSFNLFGRFGDWFSTSCEEIPHLRSSFAIFLSFRTSDMLCYYVL